MKPWTKQELGIFKFWETVSVEKCNKCISHLNKVITRVIELEGATTGYSSLHYSYLLFVIITFLCSSCIVSDFIDV